MILRCPQCKKIYLDRGHNNPHELVLKTRLLKFKESGGPVFVKCRQCGYLIKVPFLKTAI